MGLRLATAAVVAAASLTLTGAETTRTLKIELAADVRGAFAVENLAGVMRVTIGTSDRVVATATVHAEDADAAAGVQFLQVAGDDGTPTLRVRYPLSDYGTIRYPGRRSDDSVSFLSGLFGGSNTTTKYDGHKAMVSSTSGTLLYADVEVQLPGRDLEATFRNLVGKLEGTGVQGKLLFDASSGDIVLDGVRGSIRADTGSGDVKATGAGGSLTCDTGSGDCTTPPSTATLSRATSAPATSRSAAPGRSASRPTPARGTCRWRRPTRPSWWPTAAPGTSTSRRAARVSRA